MKKTILNVTVALLASTGLTNAQDTIVLEDFDNNRNINTWIPDGGSFLVSSNEAPGSADNTVGFFDLNIDRIDENANFIGSLVEDVMGRTGSFQSYNIDEYPYYTLDLYSSETFNFAMKVEDGDLDPKPTLAEVFVDYETPGEWKTFVFDLSDAIGKGTKNEVVFLMDIFNDVTPKELYFDNFKAYKQLPTAVNEKVIKNNLVTYPNPVVSTLNISSENVLGTVESISVFNALGNEVKSIESNTKTIDVSALESGIYTLSISSNEGVYTSSFVKE